MDLGFALTLQVGTPWEGHYTAAQIRDMELGLLAALGWRTATVTAADCVDALLLETSALGELQWQLKSTVRQQAYAVIAHALARESVGVAGIVGCSLMPVHSVSCHLGGTAVEWAVLGAQSRWMMEWNAIWTSPVTQHLTDHVGVPWRVSCATCHTAAG